MEPRRIRFFALGLAVVAVVLAAAAVAVVVGRSEPAPSTGSGSAGSGSAEPAVRTLAVTADDVAAIENHVQREPAGVQVMDLELANRLGLEAGDVITSISGHTLTRSFDVRLATGMIGRGSLAYIEVTRGSDSVLLRWRIDGDLYAARERNRPAAPLATLSGGSGLSGTGVGVYTTPTPTPDPAVDALIATIEKIDDTHYRIPRKTVDAMVANPMKVIGGARVVPAMRSGQPDGFKLYAIRPSSLYANLGLINGDTIQTVNGLPMKSADQVLEAYVKLRTASEIQVQLERRGQLVNLTITIK